MRILNCEMTVPPALEFQEFALSNDFALKQAAIIEAKVNALNPADENYLEQSKKLKDNYIAIMREANIYNREFLKKYGLNKELNFAEYNQALKEFSSFCSLNKEVEKNL